MGPVGMSIAGETERDGERRRETERDGERERGERRDDGGRGNGTGEPPLVCVDEINERERERERNHVRYPE
jgi:hypothetical protein